MKLFIRFFLILVLGVSQTNSFGQIFKPFPKGLGIEIGGGQNNLFWNVFYGSEVPGTAPIDRTDIYITPNIRINYNIQFTDDFSALLFLGYNKFGGRKEQKYQLPGEDRISEGKYIFDAIESGSFFLWNYSNILVGIGLKINRNLRVKYQLSESNLLSNEDRTEWFIKWSENAGIRITYLLLPIDISIEGWFGLNDLRNFTSYRPDGIIRENHYRIFIGYTF